MSPLQLFVIFESKEKRPTTIIRTIIVRVATDAPKLNIQFSANGELDKPRIEILSAIVFGAESRCLMSIPIPRCDSCFQF